MMNKNLDKPTMTTFEERTAGIKVNKQKLQSFTHLMLIMLLGMVLLGAGGCKAKKLAAEKAAQEKILKENTKNRLRALLDDSNTMSLQEKEEELAKIKDLNLDDPEIKDLIAQVEEKLNQEREAMARTNEQNARNTGGENPSESQSELSLEYNLEKNFNEIVAAGQRGDITRSNQLISQTLNYFNSPNAVVLIIIYQQGDVTDYDEPTTISKYLNYLKDVKVNPNSIYKIRQDASGKIKELDLIKR